MIRVSNDLSLSEMAAPIGVSPVTIFRWERGERMPQGDRAVAYLRQLEALGEAS